MNKFIQKILYKILPAYRVGKNNRVQIEVNRQVIINAQKEILEKLSDIEKINKDSIKEYLLKSIYEGTNEHDSALFRIAVKNSEMDNLYESSINRIDVTMLREMIKNEHDKYINTVCLTDLDIEYPEYKYINISQICNYKNKDVVFVLAFNQDFNAIKAIEEINKIAGKYVSVFQPAPLARYLNVDKIAFDTLIDEYSNSRKGHFCSIDFENIFQMIKETKDLDGEYVEIGTYQGASARATLNYMRRVGDTRNAYFIDTYEGFTYNEAQESDDITWSGTHTNTSEGSVRDYLKEYSNAKVVKKNIITDELPEEICKISACNIDVDIYDAVKVALEKVHPLIVQHGIIICEDYGHTPLLIGAQKAVREFVEKYGDSYIKLYFTSGQMFLVRK